MDKKFLYLLFVFSLYLSACSYVFTKSYGIKSQVNDYTEQELLEKAEKLGIANYPLCRVKPSLEGMLDSIANLDTSYFLTVKSLFQPLQLIAFDSDGSLNGLIANCDAGGFPNLKWSHLLDTMPARAAYFNEEIPFSKAMLFKHFEKVNEEEINEGDVLVLAYTHFMGRQNKRFIDRVLNYHSNHASKATLVFVNYDLKEFYGEP